MSDLRDPSGYNLKLATAPPQTIAPAISKQSTTANLANGAQIDLEFTIDQVPILDMMLSADQVLTVQTFVRIDTTDTYRQIDNDINSAGSAKYERMLDGKRFPGSLLRVRIINNSGVATTRLAAEVQARST